MHDTINLESKGIPTAVFIVEPFVRASRLLAEIQGLPDYPFLVLPSPFALLAAEQTRERAREFTSRVKLTLVNERE